MPSLPNVSKPISLSVSKQVSSQNLGSVGTRTPLEVVYEHYKLKDMQVQQSRSDLATQQPSRYINTGLQSHAGSLSHQALSGGAPKRHQDYVKVARRESRFLANEVQKLNGILSDIRLDKRYEDQLKRRFQQDDKEMEQEAKKDLTESRMNIEVAVFAP